MNLPQFPQRYREKALIGFIIISFLVPAFFHLYRIIIATFYQFTPVGSDEFDYMKSVESFFYNSDLYAFSTFDEIYAQAGNYSFHGPLFALIYGIPSYISGVYSNKIVLYENMALSVLTIIIAVFFASKNKTNNIIFSAIILCSTIFVVYSTTYMTEPLQLFIAVLLVAIYANSKNNTFAFQIFTLLSGFLRQSNIFYLFTLLPRSKTPREFLFYILVFLVSLFLVLVQIKYFNASFPGGVFNSIVSNLYSLDFFQAITIAANNFQINFDRFYFSVGSDSFFYMGTKYLYTLVTVYALLAGYISKNRILLGGGLVGLVYLIALFTLYDAKDWRELRSLAAPFLYMVAMINLAGNRNALISILLFELVLFPSLNTYRTNFTNQRLIPFGEKLKASNKEIAAYKNLANLPLRSSLRNEILINVDKQAISTVSSVAMYSLPVRSSHGYPIRYTFAWKTAPYNSSADYLLTKNTCKPGLDKFSTKWFKICRLKP